jgi:hypothetical protein
MHKAFTVDYIIDPVNYFILFKSIQQTHEKNFRIFDKPCIMKLNVFFWVTGAYLKYRVTTGG